jgi:hypothetical protein
MALYHRMAIRYTSQHGPVSIDGSDKFVCVHADLCVQIRDRSFLQKGALRPSRALIEN